MPQFPTDASEIERRRESAEQAAWQRRRLQATVRGARERLTSNTGLDRAFTYQLMRMFAQSRTSASVALLVFSLVIAASALAWAPPARIATWGAIVLVASLFYLTSCRAFLQLLPQQVDLAGWRLRFVVFEFVFVGTWVTLPLVVGTPEGEALRLFVLFSLLLFGAVTVVLSAPVPGAVYAGLLPLSLSVWTMAMPDGHQANIMIAAACGAAVLFFVLLASRLHATALETIAHRTEKDTLIVELEEAQAKSEEARKRAEDANLAKSRFLATMSHELRTPLNAILGFSEVMKNELFGPHSSPQYREYARDIHESGEHLLALINEILDLSRIEAGRYTLNEEAIDLTDVVDDCVRMMEIKAHARSLTIERRFEGGMPKLWADERAVRQIALNLLSNAVKFSPQGARIFVKAGWTSGGGQYLSVTDQGPGIPEEELETVMSSFGRGSFAIKAAEQGSGLGLPIVQGLANVHGGHFQLNSRVREGTEAIVTFPPTRVMEALAALGPDPAPAGGKRRAA